MRMRKDLQSCGVMRVREQICNPRAQLTEMRVRDNLVPRVFVPLDQRSKNERLWEHPFLNNRILPIRFHCAVSDFLQNGGPGNNRSLS